VPPDMCRDTDAADTPARLATSLIVTTGNLSRR
jgi:hypothetical protein